MQVDKAHPGELSTVLSVLDEAAAWLQAQEIQQWPAQFSGHEGWRQERIRSYVQAGQTWLVRIDGEVAAVFTTTSVADSDFAHGWPDQQPALYVFRMAVRRAFAGRDLGGHILDWASAYAAAQGYTWLRLDCHRANRALQRYYEQRGFKRVGTVVQTRTGDDGQPYERASGALYQRFATVSDFPGEDNPMINTRYDSNGVATIWQEASNLVAAMKSDDPPVEDAWNAALEQAANTLREGPEGVAAIWQEASNLVAAMKSENSSIVDPWNTALEQAARALQVRASETKQANGMYYRPLTGKTIETQLHDSAD